MKTSRRTSIAFTLTSPSSLMKTSSKRARNSVRFPSPRSSPSLSLSPSSCPYPSLSPSTSPSPSPSPSPSTFPSLTSPPPSYFSSRLLLEIRVSWDSEGNDPPGPISQFPHFGFPDALMNAINTAGYQVLSSTFTTSIGAASSSISSFPLHRSLVQLFAMSCFPSRFCGLRGIFHRILEFGFFFEYHCIVSLEVILRVFFLSCRSRRQSRSKPSPSPWSVAISSALPKLVPVPRRFLSPSYYLSPIPNIHRIHPGKTAAFVWPMLVHIMAQRPVEEGDGAIGVIVAPTRELAEQIYLETKKFSKGLKLRYVRSLNDGGGKLQPSSNGGAMKPTRIDFRLFTIGYCFGNGCFLISFPMLVEWRQSLEECRIRRSRSNSSDKAFTLSSRLLDALLVLSSPFLFNKMSVSFSLVVCLSLIWKWEEIGMQHVDMFVERLYVGYRYDQAEASEDESCHLLGAR